MADELDPDRAAPGVPVRVAQFEGFGGDGSPAFRTAEFDELDAAEEPAQRTAAFEDLDAAAGPASRTAGLDGFGRSAPTSGAGRVAGFGDSTALPPAARRDGRPPEGRPDDRRAAVDGGAAVERSGAAAPGATDPGFADDGIPPDGPLPRGRRRGRGARAGRLGPDAPDPEQPEPAADPVAVAREICLRLLTDRARTRQELAQALARKSVPAEAAAAVLDRFDEVGLIDDAAFAGQWVRSRHENRGLGRRAIAVELRRKGVADDVAGEALAEVDAESEARRARELVDRKLRSLATDTAEQRATVGRRLVGMLARKGYGAGIAYRVVREALADRGAEVDELGSAEAAED